MNTGRFLLLFGLALATGRTVLRTRRRQIPWRPISPRRPSPRLDLPGKRSRHSRLFLRRRGEIPKHVPGEGGPGGLVLRVTRKGKGEISDAVRLSNGNVLLAHQFAVKLVSHPIRR